MSILAFRWLPLPSAPEDAEKVASGGTITWSVPLDALALLAFSIMLVEGAIADWSAIYLRTSVLTGPGLAALGYAVFSGAMAGGRLTGDYFTGKLGRGHSYVTGLFWPRQGLSSSCCSAMPVGRWWDLRALEQVWPRLFPIRLPLQGTLKAVHPVSASP